MFMLGLLMMMVWVTGCWLEGSILAGTFNFSNFYNLVFINIITKNKIISELPTTLDYYLFQSPERSFIPPIHLYHSMDTFLLNRSHNHTY